MDPVSLAGLGLGAASLAFQLFAGCVKGFVLLSTAHNLGKDSSTLLCMLNLQEVRLTEWARRAGLLGEDRALDRRLNETVIGSVLAELQDLLLDTTKLKRRYKLELVDKAPPLPAHIGHGDAVVPRGILGEAISDPLRSDIMYHAGLIQSRTRFPQRLWWAAVDKNKFSELIDNLRLLITELWHLQDAVRQEDMSRELSLVLSHVISLGDKVDQIAPLRETLQQSNSSTLSPEKRTHDVNLTGVAKLKLVNLQMAELAEDSTDARSLTMTSLGMSENPRAKQADLQLDLRHLGDFRPLKGSPEMGLAQYQEQSVFVEWRQLPTHSRGKITARIYDLATLLRAPKPTDFRTLQCMGLAFDNDSGRVAFIYHFTMYLTPQLRRDAPDHLAASPQSLRSLFRENPSVTDRIRVALQITQSLKYLHTAGWLHKNLRSENILFTGSVLYSPSEAYRLLHPILVGFAYSRQDSPSQISEQPSADPERDIYRHPEAMGEPSVSFSAEKEIYSLGTILLEIGEWRSLKSLVKKVVDLEKQPPLVELAKVRPFLLDETPQGGLHTLKYRMGDIYARVTKMMLRGEIPEIYASEKGESSIFRPDILDIAVRELDKCTT